LLACDSKIFHTFSNDVLLRQVLRPTLTVFPWKKIYSITVLEKMSKNVGIITHWASLTGPCWQHSYMEQGASVGHFHSHTNTLPFKAVISTGGYLGIHM